jgi:dihydroorotate dehydrogenase
LKLRGIDFGHVLDASGARGWFGEGYLFHRWVLSGLSFEGSTFVAKTTTLNPRRGNAAMSPDRLTPRVFGQRCVKVSWRKGVVLNAFGLPGPGVAALLETGRWQQRETPFLLSFMAIEPSPQDSLREVRSFVHTLKRELPNFSAPVGLQVNFSCPNVDAGEHLSNFRSHLDEYQALEIPIMAKLSAALSVEAALAIEEHPGCDAICVSNSIA